MTYNIPIKENAAKEVVLEIPLSALNLISRYPKEKKIICEIDLSGIKGLKLDKTLDKIINEGRFDYWLGNYTTYNSAKSLIAELRA